MNKIERKIYDVVKKNPKVKNNIRDIYQTFMYYCFPNKKMQSKYKVITHKGYFFGFHDKIPFSIDDKSILVHKINSSKNILPKKETFISIGLLHGDKYQNYKELYKTNAWNFQQGSMLQWVGKTNNVLFNFFDKKKNKHVSLIVNQEGEIIKALPVAVGALDPTGKFALSYSFERLRKGMPGYGYANGIDKSKNLLVPEQGLYLVDIEDNQTEELFTIEELIHFKREESMEGAFHFLTHCLFSPSGNRFLFFHRWYKGSERLHTHMFTANIDGSELHIFPTTGMVSHVTWINDSEILAYAETFEGDNYYLFTDKTNFYKQVGKDFLNCDGHPQVSPNGECFITDTYPNRNRIQELKSYDLKKDKGYLIGKFRSPLKFKDTYRCDLHPRWNRAGNKICIDSTYLGERSISIIYLNGDK